MAGDTLAVQRLHPTVPTASTRVDVFDLTDDVMTPIVALQADIGRAHLGLGADGTIIAISGVGDRADAGEIQFFARSEDRWNAAARFEAVGGGPIVVDGPSFFVQRNGFFTKSAGSWTRFRIEGDGSVALAATYPVQAASLAVDGEFLAFGMPDHVRVLTFRSSELEGSGATSDLRLQQMLWPPPVSDPDRPSGPTEFGASVGLVSGRLVVAAPGRSIDGIPDEGELVVYTTTTASG